MFDYPVERSIELLVNGTRKFTAQVVGAGKRRACLIEQIRRPAGQGRISEEGAGVVRRAGARNRMPRSESRNARPRRRPLFRSSSTRCRNTSTPENIRVARAGHPELLLLPLPEFGDARSARRGKRWPPAGSAARSRNRRRSAGCDRCGSALRAPPGRRNRPPRASPTPRRHEIAPEERQQRFVLLDETVSVMRMSWFGMCAGSIGARLLVPPRFLQVLALERAIHRHFALGAAADRANVSPDTGAEAPRTASLANCAGHSLSIEVEGNRRPNEPHESLF